jgi:hypothetical protein
MSKPAQKKVAQGKTVFGMPALQKPLVPGVTPGQPQTPSSDQPATARPKDPVKRDTPAGLHAPDMETTSMEAKAPAAQPEDAYKATVVGMGAAGAEPKDEEPSLEETRDTETTPDEPEGGAPKADDVHAETLAAGSQEASAVSTAMGKAAEAAPRSQGTEQPPLWLLILLIGIIVVLIVLAAYFLFF